ncbi:MULTISPECIES: DNA translocase FtsK [unclassified Sporosarcina]|uniref:DNA translocase FtsK n=1 Tax=unclassified Sporosarcina TaxID=2647733 RepID=UPI00203C287B|nr:MULTISPECIES: DNA translocase FtsK [unclassified Sporosarcina]GKV64137.1 DNA translocase SpoIIIE [Sporosarcina sp. NCCP-2331]GLB54398.1 DNA translocase SpoIIIE [Sporosarcina sp. NCCP-2378]
MAKKKAKKKTPAKKRPQQKKQGQIQPLWFEILGVVLIGLSIILIFEYGVIGRGLAAFSRFLLGNWHAALPFLIIVQALVFMIKRQMGGYKHRIVLGCLFILSSMLLFSHIHLFQTLYESKVLMSNSALKETWKVLVTGGGIFNQDGTLGGGMIGAVLFAMFHSLVDSAGATVAGVLLLLIGIILLTGKALIPYVAEQAPLFIERVKKKWAAREKKPVKSPEENRKELSRSNRKKQQKKIAEPVIEEIAEDMEPASEPIISSFTSKIEPVAEPEKATEPSEQEVQETPAEGAPEYPVMGGEQENESYILPSTSLLEPPVASDQSGEYDLIQTNAKKLEKTFLSFGVKARVTQVHLGPAVTKYEILPDAGVKVSRIVSLTDDIALALAANGIRIEAPIPGKSAVGIEVPNNAVAMVSLREILESKENNRAHSKLLVGLGRDVTGQAMMTELNKMPHVLIAGATGSGKSVCVNGIIMSIIMRAKPHEVKMMMIDPKMVELNVFNGIPHLLAPVVTDPRKAAQALQRVVSEMERRYELFSHTGTRNIEGYNNHIEQWNEDHDEKHPRMPYIVVIVDELADLMMVASNEVEDSITRLAQMARAAGIHLIIATQRPSVDVITGIIKANIPSRIAFAVSSAIDSRTILDGGGAEKLLGRGDMLFLPAGASKPTRIQGAFVSDEEVEAVVNFIIEQQKAQYQEEMIPTEVEVLQPHEETDDLYDEAVQMVVDMQTASVSMIQRRFRVGYARAARIVDQMEAHGVVGPPEGSKPRQVLVSKSELDQ